MTWHGEETRHTGVLRSQSSPSLADPPSFSQMSRISTTSMLLACGACAAFGAVVATAAQARRASPGAPPVHPPSRDRTRADSEAGRERRRFMPQDPALNRDHAARDRVDALSRRKQDFLGLLSHELRNPLSAIQVAL